MEKFRSCLVEMLLESKKVKIDGLGIFYCTIENALGGAESPAKFNVQKNLAALHIRFLPEQKQEMNISSREFIKKAEFINIATLLKGDDATDGTTGNTDGTTDNTDLTDETTNGTNNSNEGGSNSGSQSGGDNSGSNSGSGNNQGGNTGGNGGDDENIDEGII